MLYDPKWEVKSKPEYSLRGLVAWLERMPADRTYSYRDAGYCLNAQFHHVCGLEYDVPNPFAFWRWNTPRYKIEWAVAAEKPYTFGAALKRARALKG